MNPLTPPEKAALAAIDEGGLVACLRDLVAIPSVSGTPAESEAQYRFAARLEEAGLVADLWPIDLDSLVTAPRTLVLCILRFCDAG